MSTYNTNFTLIEPHIVRLNEHASFNCITLSGYYYKFEGASMDRVLDPNLWYYKSDILTYGSIFDTIYSIKFALEHFYENPIQNHL